MITAATHSVEETRELAAALAERARPGDVLLLSGDLGAGKTAFVQGYAAALGVSEVVTSPTFTLASEYRGRLELHHLDVYRLERFEEAVELGLYDLLDGEGVVVIEWGDAVAPLLPNDYLRVSIELGQGDDDRFVRLEPVGARWTARAAGLTAVLAPWAGEETSC